MTAVDALAARGNEAVAFVKGRLEAVKAEAWRNSKAGTTIGPVEIEIHLAPATRAADTP